MLWSIYSNNIWCCSPTSLYTNGDCSCNNNFMYQYIVIHNTTICIHWAYCILHFAMVQSHFLQAVLFPISLCLHIHNCCNFVTVTNYALSHCIFSIILTWSRAMECERVNSFSSAIFPGHTSPVVCKEILLQERLEQQKTGGTRWHLL